MGTSWDVVNGLAVLVFIGWRIGAIEVDNWSFSVDSIWHSNTPEPALVLEGNDEHGHHERAMGGDGEGSRPKREASQYPIQIQR